MPSDFYNALKAWAAFASAIIALIAMIVSIVNARKSKASSDRAKDDAEAMKRLHEGEAETTLRESITRARERYEDISLRIADIAKGRELENLSPEERGYAEKLRAVQLSAMENLVNTYENACSKYRDHKIDRTRFKKTYVDEVATMFREHTNCYGRHLHPQGTSKFKALWAVYLEWHDLENQAAGRDTNNRKGSGGDS